MKDGLAPIPVTPLLAVKDLWVSTTASMVRGVSFYVGAGEIVTSSEPTAL
jgi:ABC-type uncharacterized transport system ATPase subunit